MHSKANANNATELKLGPSVNESTEGKASRTGVSDVESQIDLEVLTMHFLVLQHNEGVERFFRRKMGLNCTVERQRERERERER